MVKKVHGTKRRVRVCAKPSLPSAGTVVAVISLPEGTAPAGLLALPGAVWVAGRRSDSIFRIDPFDNAVVARVSVSHGESDRPSFMAYGNETLFAIDIGGETVALVDPVHSAVERFATSSSANGFLPPVFGAGSLWVIGAGGVTRMDASGNVIATLLPGQTDKGLAFGAGSVWGSIILRGENQGEFHNPDGEVFRLDPATNQVVARIATSAVPSAFGAGSVWGVDSSGRDIVRIDPRSNSVAATIPLPALASPLSLTATDTAVWVAEGASGSRLWKIDPATNRVVGVVNLGGSSGLLGLAVGDDGSVWVSLFDADLVLRVRPN